MSSGLLPGNTAEAHQRFRNKYGLKIKLLTDRDHATMESYGAWGEKKNYGKTSMGVIRSTFLVGEDGRIERVPGTTCALTGMPSKSSKRSVSKPSSTRAPREGPMG